MAFITKQQQQEILKQIPPGQDPVKVFQGLIQRGNELEGFSSPKPTPSPIAVSPTETPQPEKQKDGFFKSLVKDPIKTLLVKPAVRTAQAGIALFGGEKGQEFVNKPIDVHIPVLGDYNIEPQKGGKAGVYQVAGDALKSASYLATPGAAKGASLAVRGAAQTGRTITQGVATGIGAGAFGGGTYAAGHALQEEDPTLESVAKETATGTALGAVTGGIVGGVSEVANKIVDQLANVGPAIEKSNLRMTPAQKTAYAKRLDKVAKYVNEQIPVGGPEARFEAASANVDTFENQIQHFLSTDAKDVVIKKPQLLDAVEQIKKEFSGERDYLEIVKQIDGFKNLVESQYPDDIPVAMLNKLKRSTYSSAFNQAGTKISDVVEYKIGDLLKTGIEGATKDVPVLGKYPIKNVNEAYGIALNAKKLLKIAMGRPEMGFTERLLADAIGLGTGGPLGGLGAHIAANTLPFTATKAMVGKLTTTASKNIPRVNIPKIAGPLSADIVGRQKENRIPKVKRP